MYDIWCLVSGKSKIAPFHIDISLSIIMGHFNSAYKVAKI